MIPGIGIPGIGIPGVIDSDASASGAIVTATITLIAGTAGVNATAPGATLTIAASLIAGSASVSVTASGALQTLTASLIPGTATGSSDVLAPGATIVIAASIIPGQATGEVIEFNRAPGIGGFVKKAPPKAPEISAQAFGQIIAVRASLIPGAASGQRIAPPAPTASPAKPYQGPALSAPAYASGGTMIAKLELVVGQPSGDGNAKGDEIEALSIAAIDRDLMDILELRRLAA